MTNNPKKPSVEIIDYQPPWDAAILFPEPSACPSCGSTNLRKLIYGLLAEPLSDEEQNIYHVGGCVVRNENWRCNGCGHEW